MFKISTIFLTLLFLTGCDFNVNNYEIEGYIKNCKDKGGIQHIDNWGQKARCNNGEIVFWNR